MNNARINELLEEAYKEFDNNERRAWFLASLGSAHATLNLAETMHKTLDEFNRIQVHADMRRGG